MFPTNALRFPRQWAPLKVALATGGLLACICLPARGAGAPIPVTLAGQPVEAFSEVTSSTRNAFAVLVYTVPAGKQLLVQSMTLIGNPLDATIGYTAFVRVQTSAGSLYSIASLTAAANTGAIGATTQPMQLHVPAGGSVFVNLFRSTVGPLDVFIGLSGLSTDAP